MSHFCAAAALLGANLCENDTPITAVEMTFINHMAEQGLNFGTTEEYNFRLALFSATDAEYNKINADETNTFTVGHNFMSSWTKDELARMVSTAEPTSTTTDADASVFSGTPNT